MPAMWQAFRHEVGDRACPRPTSGNPHFPDATRLELVEMCADCRVVSVMEQRREPLEGAKRPRVVTSEDYMRGDSSVDET